MRVVTVSILTEQRLYRQPQAYEMDEIAGGAVGLRKASRPDSVECLTCLYWLSSGDGTEHRVRLRFISLMTGICLMVLKPLSYGSCAC